MSEWDEVLEQAAESPRGLLSELLARADEVENIVIVFEGSNGKIESWFNVSHQAIAISLLEYAKWQELSHMKEEGISGA